jgi:hypothetical protein
MLTVDQLRHAVMIPARSLVDETHFTIPMPVGPPKSRRIGVLACPETLVPDRKLRFLAPDYVIYLSADDGQFLQMKAVEPSDFGQSHQPGELIGGWGVDQLPNTPDEISQMWKDWIATIDRLLPVYLFERRPTAEDRQTAREFFRLFDIISEVALRPYYRALAKEFFAWLEQIAK